MKIGLDLDGTLISCEKKQIQCLRDGLESFADDIDWADIWHRKRNGATNFVALRSYGVPEERIAEASLFWNRNIESEVYQGLDYVFPGAFEALAKLHELGSLHLISARKNKDTFISQISRLRLSSHFHEAIVVSDAKVREGKASLLRDLNIDCYLGDTETDWEASVAAGSTPYILCTGQRSEQFLRKFGVAAIYQSLEEVAEKLHASYSE